MIHLENSVPEFYTEKSRDFQLLCKVLNIFLNSSIGSAHKIINNWSVESLDEALLPLMTRRLGFTEGSYIPPAILRNICKSYPRIIRYKGTQQAVREAAYAVFSAHQEVTSLGVSSTSGSNPSVHIECNVVAGDESYLELMFPYILPAGVSCDITLGISSKYQPETTTATNLTISRIRGAGSSISKIVGGEPKENQKFDPNALGDTEWNKNLTNSEPALIYSKVNVGLIRRPEVTNTTVNTIIRDKDQELKGKKK